MEFTLPQEVKSLLMKVAVSGHGHDQGRFIERTGYVTRNAAEFDENTYTIVINGVTQKRPEESSTATRTTTLRPGPISMTGPTGLPEIR